MYPPIDKNQMPSAPPPYSVSQNAQHFQQTGYPPQFPPNQGLQQPTQVIVVQGPASIPPLGTYSVNLQCPSCKAHVNTYVDEDASTSAYLCCMLLFVVGCVLCSCLPFCMENFRSYKHSCPNCHAFIGSYQPS